MIFGHSEGLWRRSWPEFGRSWELWGRSWAVFGRSEGLSRRSGPEKGQRSGWARQREMRACADRLPEAPRRNLTVDSWSRKKLLFLFCFEGVL